MKKRVRFVIGFATLVAAGCTVKVNGEVHKFGVSGEDDKKAGDGQSSSGGAANPDDLAAELAGGATPAGQSFTLKPDFTPNPTVLGTFSTMGEVGINGKPHGVSRCSGYVGAGATAVINLTSPRKKTRFSAPGAGLILVEFGDGKYACDSGGSAPGVMLDEWPAGALTVFVGGRKDESYSYELRVEDEDRPLDIPWKNTVKATEIAELPKDPIVITQTTAKETGHKGTRCGDSFFRETPDVVISLKRPLGDMSIDVRSAKAIDVQLVGPLNDTGRKLPIHCGSDGRIGIQRMEPGLYGLRIGTAASGDEVLHHVVIRGKDTTRNPALPPSKFPDAIALEESVVTWHYPQLTLSDMEANEAVREAVFLSAPKAMFVFPKFNMDKSVAEAVGYSRDSKAPAPEYPKENEPLLLLARNGLVVATDGSVFRVSMKDLQADPGGAVVLPAAPRNKEISFDEALRFKGPEDAGAVAAWNRAEGAIDDCSDRTRYYSKARYQALCGGLERAADASKQSLYKGLVRNRTTRRTKSLAKIKPQVEGLFK